MTRSSPVRNSSNHQRQKDEETGGTLNDFTRATASSRMPPPPPPSGPPPAAAMRAASLSQDEEATITPLIYASPTTDTLGDESSLLFASAPQYATPPRHNNRQQRQRLVEQQQVRSAPPKQPPPRPRHNPRGPSSTAAGPSATTASRSTSQLRNNTSPLRHHVRRRRRPRVPATKGSGMPRDFQHEEDYAQVTVRSVNVAQRSAFECHPLISLSEWKRRAEQHASSSSSSSRSKSKQLKRNKYLSPSYQHLELLHTMRAMTVIRQAQFSPSTSLDSDLFVPWDADDDDDDSDDDDDNDKDEKRRKQQKGRRDGRYRSIDPVKATVATLPPTPPVLSHKKTRLPYRSDVGFPNATSQEIELKQLEIRNETEWEQASPRIVVLVTSDDLGTAVTNDDDKKNKNKKQQQQLKNISRQHLEWNGGGLEGMPFCGRELIRAKERNAMYFGQPRIIPSGDGDAAADQNTNNNILQANPYSSLAPPLDASYSASQGWRPRPFHDRPAGLEYCLACPLDVSFAIGNVEPLVCSLALYSLPAADVGNNKTAGVPKDHQAAYGKMSEEFWFPAGDWTGKVQLEAARREDGSMDENIIASWLKRKHKAIFSYNPLALSGGRDSLFIVLNVYKVAHADGQSAYIMRGPNGEGSENDATDSDTIRQRANQVFQQLGVQLLSPLCFGVSKLYSPSGGAKQMKWPLGETREMNFYACPLAPESQEAFVLRLSNIVRTLSDQSVDVGEQQLSVEDRSDTLTATTSSESTDSTRKKTSVARFFMSPMKAGKPCEATLPDHASESNESVTVAGRGKIFVSSLTVDFLQAMLSNPSEWGENESDDEQQIVPKLLADVSGDSAVLFDPTQAQATTGSPSRKKSSLLRLPLPGEPAGYMAASEFREVLYLPARPEKHYDVDIGLSYRSLLNLIYLYPRVLRLSSGDKNFDRQSFTVRIRVLHSEASGGDGASHETCAFHSPAPWAGQTLVSEVYTKIAGNLVEMQDKASNLKAGIPMRDELKLRLPSVLDGTYSLSFALFSVKVSNDGTVLRPIAEASIPLSSSSSREASSGSRVATIIPNGNHRLKLGDFQLQLETRLVSAIHVGDPAVATMLRDFPYKREQHQDRFEEESTILPRGHSSTSASIDSASDFEEPFASILSTASGGTVAGNFDILLHAHLSNLVRDKRRAEPDGTAQFMTANMKSLFEVFRKGKCRLLTASREVGNDRPWEQFLKGHLDALDERYLSSVSSPLGVHSGLTVETSDSNSEALQIDLNPPQEEDFVDDEAKDEGAVRIRGKSDGLSQHELRVSRIIASLGASGAPFSRVAYGASKMDRMRIAAELHIEGSHSSHLFDDDETIATMQTFQTASRPNNVDLASRHFFGSSSDDYSDGNSIVRTASMTTQPVETGHHRHSSGGSEFAKRVRTAAQVILAPCVGPSFSNMLAKSSSPRPVEAEEEKGNEPSVEYENASMKEPAPPCASSSDVDDDNISMQGSEVSRRRSSKSIFRGPPDSPMLSFSIKCVDGREVPLSRGEYIYESVMVLWLRSWLDHVERTLVEPLDTSTITARQFATFPIPQYNPSVDEEGSIYSYYAHMDILLPLCLKSIVLRYSVEVEPIYPPSTRTMVDESHVVVLELFVEMLARGLIGQALAGLGSAATNHEKALLTALSSSDVVLDFLVGLTAILHPEHMRSLLRIFFKTLRRCETEHLGESCSEYEFEWSEESLHRVRCSRQIRLHAVERFAVLPSFVALNYPPKYSESKGPPRYKKATWMHQYNEIPEDSYSDYGHPAYPDGIDRLPPCGWLAELVINEGLSVCALSCETVVAEAMAHSEVSTNAKTKISSSVTATSLKKRPGAALKRADLLMFQSLAIHAVTCVYELVFRRHAMDKRFQTEKCRQRIAGIVSGPILDKSISSVRWLARMEATHKVRSIWLLCFVYVLQEAPESRIRYYVRSLCDPKDVRIHRFIRLLRLCSSTFQGFVDLPRHALFPSEIDKGMSPWLLQESFNTICAATNIVVEECVDVTSNFLHEQEKVMAGILDLLLHLLTTPQSPVTHLRAVGGAIQTLDRFGVELFLKITGLDLQHWIRVVLSLMNSKSLSVRSIAVDFVVSLLGSTFDLHGDIDGISIIFASVLPEVAAREIALYSVSDRITTADDMARSLWPLRRSIADLEGSNPLDDERVDTQLAPILVVFCRACQAVLDGVLIEMRLRGENAIVVGTKVACVPDKISAFDADEESLLEAATFFLPETAPVQRIRWLLTLKSLHEANGKWVEAAETLFLCARTISDSIPHLKHVWRPSRFDLWSDSRRSLWLDTVGEDVGNPARGNAQVMDFADDFLEPPEILGTPSAPSATGKLQQPTVPIMSSKLVQVAKDGVSFYLRESGMDELAYTRLESLMKAVMHVLDAHSSQIPVRGNLRTIGATARKRHVEDEASLRRVLASISGDMTRLAERMLVDVQNEPNTPDSGLNTPTIAVKRPSAKPQYVVVHISGKKPPRFQESTTLPTFLEFDTPCICRLPVAITQLAVDSPKAAAKTFCQKFAEPLLTELRKECGDESVALRTEPILGTAAGDSMTYLDVFPVEAEISAASPLGSKRFCHRKGTSEFDRSVMIETTVATAFPCALSRQGSLLTTELAYDR